MRFAYIFLLLALAMVCKVSCDENVDIVYPERLHPHRSKRDLSTALEDKAHEDSLSIRIKSKFHDDDIVLDLSRNDESHPASLLLRTYDEEGRAKHDRIEPENCHYMGHVRGKQDSSVSLSTCSDALMGVVDDGEHVFDIVPHDNGDNGDNGDKGEGAHRFSIADHLIKDISYGFRDTPQHAEVKQDGTNPQGERMVEVRPIAKSVQPYGLTNVEPQYFPYLTTNDTRWVETFVSVDHAFWNLYKTIDRCVERVLHCIASVDKAYQAINIRLVVVAIEIQNNGDAFPRHSYGGKDLDAFTKHLWQTLWKEEPFRSVSIDTAMLFTPTRWSNCGGMANLGAICKKSSTSLSLWYPDTFAGSTSTVGHEFGHTMNMKDIYGKDYDSGECTCLTKRGCFMGGFKTVRPGFETCGLARLAKLGTHCLSNRPANPLSSECGNGIKEKGEVCDCGTPETCAQTDPCCEPYSCKLKPEAQCSHTDHCCSKQCVFEKQGTECRAKTSNCDIPEYCTGESSACPADEFVIDGTSCGVGETSYCVSGGCVDTVGQQCRDLWKLGCTFKGGDGIGSSEVDLGELDEQSCITACLRLRQKDKYRSINGVTVKKSGSRGCWCEEEMYKIQNYYRHQKAYKSCFLKTFDATTSEQCWRLNTGADGYGTCSATSYEPCNAEDMTCGQLQCTASSNHQVNPAHVHFGTNYKVVDLNGTQCRAVKLHVGHSGQLKHDGVGVGMVADGTKCGQGKMCRAQKCISVRDHHIKSCPTNQDGVVCSGNGVCSHKGSCICNLGFDPKTKCVSKLAPVHGGWSAWASWGECTKQCGGGIRRRHQYCDNPAPKYGGYGCQESAKVKRWRADLRCGKEFLLSNGNQAECDPAGTYPCCSNKGWCGKTNAHCKCKQCVDYRQEGEQVRMEQEACNVEACVIGKTCRDIKQKTEAQGRKVDDGVYLIKPTADLSLHVYCDMTRDGGGWTLLVSSHTNSWTNDNVRLRNVNKPHLYQDYSILQYGNLLKNTYLDDEVFQYRLEAHTLGMWGGIWRAPNAYDLSSTNPKQNKVVLMKKFNVWSYQPDGLAQRLPYVDGPRITTSAKGVKWGCVTDNQIDVHPARWIGGSLHGDLKMSYPEHVWYWIREGCEGENCVDHGKWGQWSDFGPCKKRCDGYGEKSRSRSWLPSTSGKSLDVKPETETKTCGQRSKRACEDTTLWGKRVGAFRNIKTWQKCSEKCAETPLCVAYTYYGADSVTAQAHTCFLRKSVEEESAWEGIKATSGYRYN